LRSTIEVWNLNDQLLQQWALKEEGLISRYEESASNANTADLALPFADCRWRRMEVVEIAISAEPLKRRIVHEQEGITLIVQVDRAAFNETAEWQLISSQSCLAGLLTVLEKRHGKSTSIDAPISQCDELVNFHS
jgi:hypothetical protein